MCCIASVLYKHCNVQDIMLDSIQIQIPFNSIQICVAGVCVYVCAGFVVVGVDVVREDACVCHIDWQTNSSVHANWLIVTVLPLFATTDDMVPPSNGPQLAPVDGQSQFLRPHHGLTDPT